MQKCLIASVFHGKKDFKLLCDTKYFLKFFFYHFSLSEWVLARLSIYYLCWIQTFHSKAKTKPLFFSSLNVKTSIQLWKKQLLLQHKCISLAAAQPPLTFSRRWLVANWEIQTFFEARQADFFLERDSKVDRVEIWAIQPPGRESSAWNHQCRHFFFFFQIRAEASWLELLLPVWCSWCCFHLKEIWNVWKFATEEKMTFFLQFLDMLGFCEPAFSFSAGLS